MAYQLKYYYTFCDINDIRFRVEILETSSEAITAKEINGEASPFVIEFTEVSNKLEVFRGSGCEINITSETDRQFFSLYTGDVQQFKVRFYEVSVSGLLTLRWAGYLNSELYHEDFSQKENYPVQFTGNDGVSLLDRFNFLDENGAQITGIMTEWEVITLILDKLNLDVDNIYICTSTTSDSFTIADNETIFHKTSVACSNYIDEDGQEMTCKDVLEGILKPYTCIFLISNNSLYITDLNTLGKAGGGTVLKTFSPSDYSYKGTLTGLQTRDLSDIGFMGSSARMEAVPAYNKQIVTYSPYVQPVAFSSSFEKSVFKILTPSSTVTRGADSADYCYVVSDYPDYHLYNKNVNSIYLTYTNNVWFYGDDAITKVYYPCTCMFSWIYGTGLKNETQTDNCLRFIHSLADGYKPTSITNYVESYTDSRRMLKAVKINNLPFIVSQSGNYIKISLSMAFMTANYLGKNNDNVYSIKEGSSLNIIVKVGNYYFSNWKSTKSQTDVFANDDIADYLTDNNGYWTTTPSPCILKFKTTATNAYTTNYTIKNGGDDTDIVSGIVIPLTSSLYGQLEVYLNYEPYMRQPTYNNSDMAKIYETRIKDISISVCDKYGDDIAGSDIIYKAYMDSRFKNEGNEIKTIHGTNVDNYITELGSLLCLNSAGNYQFLKTFTREGVSGCIESLLLRSVVSNYEASTIKVTATVNRIYELITLITYSNYLASKLFMITALKNDMETGESEITMLEVHKDNLTVNTSY